MYYTRELHSTKAIGYVVCVACLLEYVYEYMKAKNLTPILVLGEGSSAFSVLIAFARK